jgi:hypothetical protein
MKLSSMAGLRSKLLTTAGVCVGMLALSVPASADTMFSVQYFEVTTASNTTTNPHQSDFFPGGVPTGTVSNNYLTGALSGGMPVYNSLETGAAGANDVSGGGVLEWWTPGTYGANTVASTGSGLLTVSSDSTHPTEMFPPNSTGGGNQGANCVAPLSTAANCEETAILTGTFNLLSPTTENFSVFADDDAFVFLSGGTLSSPVLIEDEGGIHGLAAGPTSSMLLGPGNYTITIFYADQDQVQAQLAFDNGGIPVSATPEPGSLALLGTGVLGLAGAVRRRMKR